MQRIKTIELEQASDRSRKLLEQVRKALGTIPNMFKTLANSPAVLECYMDGTRILGTGSLPPALREQLSIAVAGVNGCQYCALAHTYFGGRAGVSNTEMTANLHGDSSDARTRAALQFARRVVATRGNVTDQDLEAIRGAGFGDGEIVEIVGLTVMNIFTNYFNLVAGTEVDFPVVEVREPVGV